MSTGRLLGSFGSEPYLTDSASVLESFRHLAQEKTEFQIKVEGTATVPYTTSVEGIDTSGSEAQLLLRTQRAFPPELATNAVFEMSFNLDGQRLIASIRFLARDGFLRYRFSIPASIFLADRRHDLRYPFRPREGVFVVANDSRIPGIGLQGPLLNLSASGIGLRVDRIIRMDGLRLPVSTAHFPLGKAFPVLRIRELPKMPMLQLTGFVRHATEVQGDLHIGFEFAETHGAIRSSLEMVLALREKLRLANRAKGSGQEQERSSIPGFSRSGGSREAESMDSDGSQCFMKLWKRTQHIVVQVPRSADAEALKKRLMELGYARWTCTRDACALPSTQSQHAHLMVLGPQEDGTIRMDSLKRIRTALPQLPLLVLCEEADPLLIQDPPAPPTEILSLSGISHSNFDALLQRVLGLQEV